MHCFAALRHFILLAAAFLFAALASSAALASEESVFFTEGGVTKEAPGDPAGTYVNASFTMHLPTSVAESLHRGVSLYFNTEFTLAKKRWYWKDRPVVSASQSRRLSYSLLTHKYHLGGDGLSQSFATFRLWLDKSRLPRPLQFGSSDWDMDSDRVTLPVSPSLGSPS